MGDPIGKTTIDLFSYTDYRAFLSSYYQQKKAHSRGFSTRVWCRHLGLKSPATLNMIIKGHRHAGEQVLEKLIDYFNFSVAEKNYFEEITRLGKHKGSTRRRVDLLNRISELHPEKQTSLFDLRAFSVISNWYFYAIREMVSLPAFKEDAQWVAEALENKITPMTARQAIKTLLAVKLLGRNEEGRLVRINDEISTPSDIAHEGLKRFHEQMLTLAKESIRSVSVHKREIRASTFNLCEKDLPAFKRDIRSLLNKLYLKYEREAGEETFQLNLQLFPLTSLNKKTTRNTAL